MPVRADLLSPRHKDCLRLVYRGLTTKEIARELGIQPGTVATYCAEAKALLDAKNRRHAAVLLHDYEANSGATASPSKPGPQYEGVDPTAEHSTTFDLSRRSASPGGPLAIRNRESDNDLGIAARLAWIFALAVIIAVGFGALAAGVRTLNDLVVAGHRTEQR